MLGPSAPSVFTCPFTMMMIVYPRETPPHTRTARAQPPAGNRRWHSRPHHRRHGEHSPTARQPHSNGLCSPPKEGPGPGSALTPGITSPFDPPPPWVHTGPFAPSGIGLYTILPSLILYSVWHTKGGVGGGRILRNRRAI